MSENISPQGGIIQQEIVYRSPVIPDTIAIEQEIKSKLLGSLLLFTQTFFKFRTGRDFIVSQPIGRESHHIQICRDLTKVFKLDINRELINVAPGSGKSELLRHFVAWCMARYPDSNFLYISYSHERAESNTAIIKDIINLPHYKKMFGVELHPDFTARDSFKTTKGGSVQAFGSSGSITGADGGLPGLDRFSGAIIMDDMHKPDEVFSDTTRTSVLHNYNNTIIHRARGKNVPFIFIGQRLHEDDLPAHFINKDSFTWNKLIIKTVDEAGNIIYPEVYSKENLSKLGEYEFAAQHQQDPQPAGGGIFKATWFTCLAEEPEVLATFITGDSAETDKTYNDATVFSFWGLYKVKHGEVTTDEYALHWLDCLEIRIEPKDLQPQFMQFYYDCMRYKVKPRTIAIEKKSTGVTLLSSIKQLQGMTVIDIDRTKASGNKTARYFSIQPYISSKLVTLPRYGKHNNMCIEHMRKITANNTHRNDDIADVLYDAVKIALIDKSIIGAKKYEEVIRKQDAMVANIANYQAKLLKNRRKAIW
jgi:predicted phage terminase large subunit-like protein